MKVLSVSGGPMGKKPTRYAFCSNCGVFRGMIWVSKGTYRCENCGIYRKIDIHHKAHASSGKPRGRFQ